MKMRRHGQYPNAVVSPMGSSQTQNVSSQRMQQNVTTKKYIGQQDIVSTKDDHKSMPLKAEERWKWDRDASRGSNMMPSHQFKEDQESDAARSRYQGSRLESKFGVAERGARKDPRDFSWEQNPRAAFEDASHPHTLEGLERKFLDDVMKLTKEHQDAEDAEILHHRERLGEITGLYKEKLMAIRARQASHRDDFLRREAQARLQSYLQLMLGQYSNSEHVDSHGFVPNSAAYTDRQLEASSYRERSQQLQGSHNHGFEARGSYSGSGQVYNNSRGRYSRLSTQV